MSDKPDLVLALVHATCGHTCGVSVNEDDLRAYMKRAQLGPEWQIEELTREDAISRYRAGGTGSMQPCPACRITTTPAPGGDA